MALAILIVGGGCISGGSGQPRGPAPTEPATTRPAAPRKPVFKARLTGRSVVPGPGALSGAGVATITLEPDSGQICYEVTVTAIDPALGADVFNAPAGAIGPLTVVLDPPEEGKSTGCASAERGIIESILANPAGFYVSIRNVQFPGGALRGQLQV